MFKVFNEDDKDKDVYFKLESCFEGGIRLVVCNKEGIRVNRGNVLKINSKGYLYLYVSLNESLGLELDDLNQIMITEG